MKETNGIHVLIIDDEPLYTEPMEKILNRYGFIVTIINDPREVKEKFKPDIFDVVLLDMTMPYMTGLDVFEVIRKKSPSQRVVLSSGNPTSESKCIKLGFAAFLPKPYKVKSLYDVIISSIGQV